MKKRKLMRSRAWYRLTRKKFKKKSFWRECFAVYSSILIATLTVQLVILGIPQEIIIICLIKSLLSTIFGASVFMILRQNKFILKYRLIEMAVYAICSMPYLEITGIYLHTGDFPLLISMAKWYAITYFIMGLVIKDYIRIVKYVLEHHFIRKWIQKCKKYVVGTCFYY